MAIHNPKTPERVYDVDPWKIIETGFHPEKQRISESIFNVANEFLCVRGYFEEGYSGDHLIGSYYNHLYEMFEIKHPQNFKGLVTRGAQMLNAVDWLYTRISIDGEQLDLAKCSFSEFKRELDMKQALYTRSFVWETKSGKKTKLVFQRYTSLADTALGFQKIAFTPLNYSGEITLESGLDFNTAYEIAAGWDQTEATGADASNAQTNFWKELKNEKLSDAYAIMAQTLSSEIPLFAAFDLNAPDLTIGKTIQSDKYIGIQGTVTVSEGKESVVEKKSISCWEKTDATAVWDTGIAKVTSQQKETYANHLPKHIEAWDKVWYLLDVQIDGDPVIQQGVRFTNFQAYQTYHGENENCNALCKSAGEVYFGWVFWDSEIYVHRLHMFVNPVAAKNLLRYRYNQLQQAITRAHQLDCEGARYPFATITGMEECGSWQHVDLEIHQSVAISYAIWHHDKVFGDKEFLYNEGLEMLLQVSRFYASAGGWSPIKGDFGFYGVMGPDEFHMMVNHNCYTNVMAKRMFYYTLETLDAVKKDAPDLYKKAIEKVALKDEEPAAWKNMADKMRVVQNDQGVYEQHDGYFDLPHVDIKNLPVDQIPLYKNWAYIKIFRHNMVKQPDVLNLMYFFSQDYTMEEKKVNYEFYEERTIHESSLSPSCHAILAAELGKTKDAYDFMAYASRLDLDNYNRNTEQGIHATSGSGVWAACVYGFAGMRSDGKDPIFSPRIPSAWNSYSFRITYRGTIIKVEVDKQKARFTKESGADIQLSIYGENHKLESTIELDLAEELAQPTAA